MPGPYIKIATAEILRFADKTPVTTPAAYLGWHRERLEEAGDVARAWRCDLPVQALINFGRWVAPCPNCQTATPLTHPVWKVGCCDDCGCVFTNVIFPADYPAIEATLLDRPVRKTQNWLPTETIEDLRRENSDHGVCV